MNTATHSPYISLIELNSFNKTHTYFRNSQMVDLKCLEAAMLNLVRGYRQTKIERGYARAKDGRMWVTMSMAQWKEHFPRETEWDIRCALQRLVYLNYLMKSQPHGYDRTAAYAFPNEALAEMALDGSHHEEKAATRAKKFKDYNQVGHTAIPPVLVALCSKLNTKDPHFYGYLARKCSEVHRNMNQNLEY